LETVLKIPEKRRLNTAEQLNRFWHCRLSFVAATKYSASLLRIAEGTTEVKVKTEARLDKSRGDNGEIFSAGHLEGGFKFRKKLMDGGKLPLDSRRDYG
jgi:hypothetical protein